MGWNGQLAGEVVQGYWGFCFWRIIECRQGSGRCYMRCLATILAILCYSRVM